MVDTVKLSIQEVINDFEELVRYDERLGVYFDFKKAGDNDISDFSQRMEELSRKYLPNTTDNYLAEAGDDEYERGLALYKILYDNFREIFCKLV